MEKEMDYGSCEDMKKRGCLILVILLVFTGCSAVNCAFAAESIKSVKDFRTVPGGAERIRQHSETFSDKAAMALSAPTITEMDWSAYFEGINGTAVLYNPLQKNYRIYNQELAETRRSPCSTFKIISSLIALEYEIIEPEDSVRTWSGERFWNNAWNKDIAFSEAFYTSCVWYFREVIDEIGKDRMQTELNKLSYGNCDISDWEGHLNQNNGNPALTGFWIESSLKITAKEQAEVMERIFGSHSIYKEKTRNQLKEVMLMPEQSTAACRIYGKTGMGKANGIVIDSWFSGFADTADGTIYFCVYLGETDDQNVSSQKAREIAVKIITSGLS